MHYAHYVILVGTAIIACLVARVHGNVYDTNHQGHPDQEGFGPEQIVERVSSFKKMDGRYLARPFLRKGARYSLERFEVERLTGRRLAGDFLVVGSVAWLARRDEDDRRQTEAEDEAARVDACFANPDLYEFMLPASGKWIKWPCSSCNDGVMSGDEVDVDCGGSCDMCLVQPEPEPEAWRPPEEECNEPEGLLEGSERTCENGDGNNTESAFLHAQKIEYNHETGAGAQAGYNVGDNPVYPWTAGSWIYNMSGYKNWVPTGVNDTVNPFGRRLEEGGQPRRALQLDPYHVTGHR